MQNSIMVLTFSVLDQKYSFWTNLIQKFKIASLSCILVTRLIWIWRIQWWFSFFLLTQEINFLSKFGFWNLLPTLHAFFMSNTFVSNTRLKLAKNQAKAKQHPEVELLTIMSKKWICLHQWNYFFNCNEN